MLHRQENWPLKVHFWWVSFTLCDSLILVAIFKHLLELQLPDLSEISDANKREYERVQKAAEDLMKPLKPTRFEKKWDHKRKLSTIFEFSRKKNWHILTSIKCNIRNCFGAGRDPYKASFQRPDAALWNLRTCDKQINQAYVNWKAGRFWGRSFCSRFRSFRSTDKSKIHQKKCSTIFLASIYKVPRNGDEDKFLDCGAKFSRQNGELGLGSELTRKRLHRSDNNAHCVYVHSSGKLSKVLHFFRIFTSFWRLLGQLQRKRNQCLIDADL